MISRNALQHKEEIFRLLQLSYPNMRRRMSESVFERRFEPNRCLYIAEEGRVISTLQTHRAGMMFMGRCLEVCLIDQIATHPDYRRRHKMSELMEAALKTASVLYQVKNGETAPFAQSPETIPMIGY